MSANQLPPIRIGQGIDVHAFHNNGMTDQFVTLAGVKIPHTHSLLAHSDGDVVLHALCDALLGAVGLGDIGTHFPDTDEQYADVDSRILLRHVYSLVQQQGFGLINADITIMAQKPKLMPHSIAMRTNISEDLQCTREQISIKATTTEQLGFVGRSEGIMVSCVVLLGKIAP